jgi:CheY-like chemotaxis protein
MDGLTAVRRIRDLEREGRLRPHVPIIAVTANARPEHVAGALEAGMDFVVTKPFRIPEVMDKMRLCIRKAAARTALHHDSTRMDLTSVGNDEKF